MAFKSIFSNFEKYPLLESKIIPDVYRDEQLTEAEERIRAICQTLVNKQSNRVTFDFYQDPTLAEILSNEMPDYIKDNFVVDKALILEGIHPFQVHSDCGHLRLEGQTYAPFAEMIIPLETVPASTITFEQTYLGLAMEEYMSSEVTPLNKHMTDEEWKEHLSHVPDWERKFLTIEKIFDWKRGDLFLYDMRRLHAGSDHRAKGLEMKKGIVLMCKVLTKDFEKLFS